MEAAEGVELHGAPVSLGGRHTGLLQGQPRHVQHLHQGTDQHQTILNINIILMGVGRAGGG